MKVIDASVNLTSAIPALKKAGITDVIRYVGEPGHSKCMLKPEADALKKAHIGIVCVCETSVTMMDSGGKSAGEARAKIAAKDMHALGVGPFCYFTCDEDVPYTAERNQWLAGAANVVGPKNCGIYGPGAFVEAALRSGHAHLGWRCQSTGFSGYGLRPKGLVLLQGFADYGSLGPLGKNYDANKALAPYIGQWGYVTPAPSGWLVSARTKKTGNLALVVQQAIAHGDIPHVATRPDGSEVFLVYCGEKAGADLDAMLSRLGIAPKRQPYSGPTDEATLMKILGTE